jgi:hypothetical protein
VRWLKDLLQQQGCLAYYDEFKFGHLSFLLPKDNRHFHDIIKQIKRHNPTFEPALPQGAALGAPLEAVRITDEQRAIFD